MEEAGAGWYLLGGTILTALGASYLGNYGIIVESTPTPILFAIFHLILHYSGFNLSAV